MAKLFWRGTLSEFFFGYKSLLKKYRRPQPLAAAAGAPSRQPSGTGILSTLLPPERGAAAHSRGRATRRGRAPFAALHFAEKLQQNGLPGAG